MEERSHQGDGGTAKAKYEESELGNNLTALTNRRIYIMDGLTLEDLVLIKRVLLIQSRQAEKLSPAEIRHYITGSGIIPRVENLLGGFYQYSLEDLLKLKESTKTELICISCEHLHNKS